MRKKLLIVLMSSYSLSASALTYVFDGTVNATLWTINGNITSQTGVIQANNVALQALLREMGSTLSSRIAQTTSMVEATGKNQITFQTQMQKLSDKKKNDEATKVQINADDNSIPICSESASVGANDVHNGASSAKSRVRPGGGGGGKSNISDSNILKAIDSPLNIVKMTQIYQL